MREQLCTLLALNAGRAITKDLAVEMVRELFPDRSYDPASFPVGGFESYTFRVERLGDIEDELRVMHAAHYLETEKYRAGIPLDMDYTRLKEFAHDGGLLQFTSRTETGELAGHMRVYLSRSMHTQTLIATEDTFFVLPEHRGSFMAVRLWQYADLCGEQIGVEETYFDSKLVNKADVMARYLGYSPISTRHARIRARQRPATLA